MSPPKLAMSMRCLIPLLAPSSHFTSGPVERRQRTLLPKIHQTHKTHGDSKVYFLQRQTWLSLNYGEHNPSHTRRYALHSQLNHISISSLTHNLSYETCSTNSNYIFHAANKNYSLKTHFDHRHLTSSSFLYYLTNLARKQLNVNTNTLQLFLAKTNKSKPTL